MGEIVLILMGFIVLWIVFFIVDVFVRIFNGYGAKFTAGCLGIFGYGGLLILALYLLIRLILI